MKKTVLVTGGAGYIGSHICKALSASGFLPIVFDNLSSDNIDAVRWGPLEIGDVRDASRLDAVMVQYRPCAVVHCAALIQVGESVINPAEYYEHNLGGSLNLLNAMRRHHIHDVVFSSTAAVYDCQSEKTLDENAPLNPMNAYGRTKLAVENLLQDYARAYDLRVAILRYFNAAGADADSEIGTAYKRDTHLIPLLMQVASGLRPHIEVYGRDYETADGTAIRDYIHVSDLADAHILALEHLLDGGENLVLNLGTGHGYSVHEIIDTARRVTHHPLPLKYAPRREGDPAILVADAHRAHEKLGWSPDRSGLENIIRTAWHWRQQQNLALFAEAA